MAGLELGGESGVHFVLTKLAGSLTLVLSAQACVVGNGTVVGWKFKCAWLGSVLGMLRRVCVGGLSVELSGVGLMLALVQIKLLQLFYPLQNQGVASKNIVVFESLFTQTNNFLVVAEGTF